VQVDKILAEYDSRRPFLEESSAKLETLLVELLRESSYKIHSVTTRVKKRDSLKRKLERPDSRYSKLDDLTDIIGARIVTYFDGDVDVVARSVAGEFNLDIVNSVDKRALLESDQFGYLSLHYIASLGASRNGLSEYRRLAELRFEIQVRSILQHAWAEIEHDLGYKSTYELPQVMWRRFFRLAGLLELADAEFSRIRDDLALYEKSVPKVVQESIKRVAIDKPTLLFFARNNPISLDLDKAIAEDAKAYIDLHDSFFSNIPRFLASLQIEYLDDVEANLREHQVQIRNLSKLFYANEKRDFVSRGASLLFLCYSLAYKKGGRVGLLEFMDKFSIALIPSDRERFVAVVQKSFSAGVVGDSV
jgi:putative GTP pyrophosphokinase